MIRGFCEGHGSGYKGVKDDWEGEGKLRDEFVGGLGLKDMESCKTDQRGG